MGISILGGFDFIEFKFGVIKIKQLSKSKIQNILVIYKEPYTKYLLFLHLFVSELFGGLVLSTLSVPPITNLVHLNVQQESHLIWPMIKGSRNILGIQFHSVNMNKTSQSSCLDAARISLTRSWNVGKTRAAISTWRRERNAWPAGGRLASVQVDTIYMSEIFQLGEISRLSLAESFIVMKCFHSVATPT